MQKIFSTALISGLMAGLFLFWLQSAKLVPLILQAETYETAELSSAHANHEHHHEEDAWEPAEGFERNAYRLLVDAGLGVGFALILVGAFSLRNEPINANHGAIWGLAGFAVFSLAPGFGLPPELPTTLAAELTARQTWWIATVACTALGLWQVVFGRNRIQHIMGVALLALPHVIGAPKAPLGGMVPTELNAAFASSSLVVMALFWVVLGSLSGWLYAQPFKRKALAR